MHQPTMTGSYITLLRAGKLALLFFALGLISTKAEDKSLDEQIRAIVAPVDKVASQAAAAAGLRVDKYLRDLQGIETAIATGSGNLDHVLIVKKERESWRKGVETDAVDPKDASLPLEFRKLRYYFDQDRSNLSAEVAKASRESRIRALQQLQALEKELTKGERIEDALAVRDARTKLEENEKAAKAIEIRWVSSKQFTIVSHGFEYEKATPESLKERVIFKSSSTGKGVDLVIPIGVFVVLESVEQVTESDQLVVSLSAPVQGASPEAMILARWKEPQHQNGGKTILPPWPQNRTFNAKLSSSAVKEVRIPVKALRQEDGRARFAIGSSGWSEEVGAEEVVVFSGLVIEGL